MKRPDETKKRRLPPDAVAASRVRPTHMPSAVLLAVAGACLVRLCAACPDRTLLMPSSPFGWDASGLFYGFALIVVFASAGLSSSGLRTAAVPLRRDPPGADRTKGLAEPLPQGCLGCCRGENRSESLSLRAAGFIRAGGAARGKLRTALLPQKRIAREGWQHRCTDPCLPFPPEAEPDSHRQYDDERPCAADLPSAPVPSCPANPAFPVATGQPERSELDGRRASGRRPVWTMLRKRIEDYFSFEPVDEDDLFREINRHRNENMTLTKKDR